MKPTEIITDEEFQIVLERVASRAIAQDIISSLPCFGWWVKDMDFKFKNISEEASNILYWLHPDDCIGRTDFEIAKSLWLDCELDWFAKVCRGSDIYIKDNPKNSEYQERSFMELITSTTGTKHIWRTTKGIVPKQEWHGVYYWGKADFLDVMGDYDTALAMTINNPNLTKLNENLFVYK